jgi:hypothetical protein
MYLAACSLCNKEAANFLVVIAKMANFCAARDLFGRAPVTTRFEAPGLVSLPYLEALFLE